MRRITACSLVICFAVSLTGCASPPSKTQASAPSYWITDPHYWDNAQRSFHRAVVASYRAGQDGAKTYRSLMSIGCAQRQRIVDAQQRAEADADCAAFVAMPASAP